MHPQGFCCPLFVESDNCMGRSLSAGRTPVKLPEHSNEHTSASLPSYAEQQTVVNKVGPHSSLLHTYCHLGMDTPVSGGNSE